MIITYASAANYARKPNPFVAGGKLGVFRIAFRRRNALDLFLSLVAFLEYYIRNSTGIATSDSTEMERERGTRGRCKTAGTANRNRRNVEAALIAVTFKILGVRVRGNERRIDYGREEGCQPASRRGGAHAHSRRSR